MNRKSNFTIWTLYNRNDIDKQDETFSFNLLTKFIATLKHITIYTNDHNNGFDRFVKDTQVLESITVDTFNPMIFLKHAQGIKYLEIHDDVFPCHPDGNVIQFIQRQTQSSLLITLYHTLSIISVIFLQVCIDV